MSKERIIYQNAPVLLRVVAFGIDIVVVAILAAISQFGAMLENELIWKSILPEAIQFSQPWWTVVWFIIELPIYYVLASGLTEGQTLGKIITGIRVVLTEGNASTKKEWKLHLKRFFLIRGGTKVVKESDPGVKGL